MGRGASSFLANIPVSQALPALPPLSPSPELVPVAARVSLLQQCQRHLLGVGWRGSYTMSVSATFTPPTPSLLKRADPPSFCDHPSARSTGLLGGEAWGR